MLPAAHLPFPPPDWYRDGDFDLLIQSEFFSFFAERSFLDHGYQPAMLTANASPIQVRAK